jgi:hypothetical protein
MELASIYITFESQLRPEVAGVSGRSANGSSRVNMRFCCLFLRCKIHEQVLKNGVLRRVFVKDSKLLALSYTQIQDVVFRVV